MGETLVAPQPNRSETQNRTEGAENKGRIARVAEAAKLKARNTAKALRERFTGSSLTAEQKLGTIAGLNRVDQAESETAVDQARTQEVGQQNKETRATLRARAKEAWTKANNLSRDTSDVIRGTFSRGETGFLARDALLSPVIDKMISAADAKLQSAAEKLRQKNEAKKDAAVDQFTKSGTILTDKANDTFTSKFAERTKGMGDRIANYFREKGAQVIDGTRAEFATMASEYYRYKGMKAGEMAMSGENAYHMRTIQIDDSHWEGVSKYDERYQEYIRENPDRRTRGDILDAIGDKHYKAQMAHFEASSLRRRANTLRANSKDVNSPALVPQAA